MRLRTLSSKLLASPLLLLFFAVPIVTQAVDFTDQLDDTAVEVYGSVDADEGDLLGIVSTLIDVVLSILGVILLLLIIYAGFLWMTAGGNSSQVDKAKGILVNAIVGLIIVLASYAISLFVVEAITQ
ncbi:hypothetical protein HON52_00455 [Candidatus Uhrbacteria bacterium]|jgi:hypothetical protein|nr:hypothetical protein [Candidatus Uhrbacteria bacterium]